MLPAHGVVSVRWGHCHHGWLQRQPHCRRSTRASMSVTSVRRNASCVPESVRCSSHPIAAVASSWATCILIVWNAENVRRLVLRRSLKWKNSLGYNETDETKNQVFGHILPLLVWPLGLFSWRSSEILDVGWLFRVIRIGWSNIAAISHHSNPGSLQIYKRAMMQLFA